MKRFTRMKLSFLLALVIVLTALPVYATAEVTQPTISPWAVYGVNDGQMMGLVSLSAENMSKDYTKEITAEDLKSLNDALVEKLDALNLKKNTAFNAETVEFKPTREAVLLNLFNILGRYDLAVKADTDPIEYFVKNNILKGNGTDNALKENATLEQGIAFYTRAVTDLYDDHDLGGKGAFYKVVNKGNTVYMLGSVHVGNISMYPIEAERMKAFNESDELYVELNLLDPEVAASAAAYQYKTDGTTLKDELGEELYGRVKAVMESLGVTEDVYEKLEGWALFNTLNILPLQMSNPYTSSLGADVYFMTNAMLDGKPIKSLETVELQMGILKDFYSTNEEGLIGNIKEAITAFENDELEEVIKEYNELIVAWRDGNVDKFATMYDEDEDSKILLETRDPEMAKKIKAMLEAEGENTYFVLVGAGHYAPGNSVLKYLRNYGFAVEDLNK